MQRNWSVGSIGFESLKGTAGLFPLGVGDARLIAFTRSKCTTAIATTLAMPNPLFLLALGYADRASGAYKLMKSKFHARVIFDGYFASTKD